MPLETNEKSVDSETSRGRGDGTGDAGGELRQVDSQSSDEQDVRDGEEDGSDAAENISSGDDEDITRDDEVEEDAADHDVDARSCQEKGGFYLVVLPRQLLRLDLRTTTRLTLEISPNATIAPIAHIGREKLPHRLDFCASVARWIIPSAALSNSLQTTSQSTGVSKVSSCATPFHELAARRLGTVDSAQVLLPLVLASWSSPSRLSRQLSISSVLLSSRRTAAHTESSFKASVRACFAIALTSSSRVQVLSMPSASWLKTELNLCFILRSASPAASFAFFLTAFRPQTRNFEYHRVSSSLSSSNLASVDANSSTARSDS